MDKLVTLKLTEIKPDSAEYKNRLTLSAQDTNVGVYVPEELFDEDSNLTPQGLGYLLTEIDICLQRAYALREPDYTAILDGSWFRKAKKRG